MKKIGIVFLTVLLLVGCSPSSDQEAEQPKPILSSDRESPIGWTYFTIYEDSTFNFNHGRRSQPKKGMVKSINDTLHFAFDKDHSENLPRWTKAVIDQDRILFFNDSSLKSEKRFYIEFTEIGLNALTEKE